MKNDSAFTLIELLVVIGILGVLATAVVLVLNPAQLLAQARDSTRLSDLATLNQTLSLFQTDQYNRSLGTSSVVYVSVPDSSPTCLNLGLPTLPGGWSYGCAPASTLQKVDGTGWIPVPLNLISSGSPLSKLPIDPVNATSTGNYYTYTPGGSWELTTILESQKQKMGGGSDKTSTDGGSYPELYEVGTNLTLLPVDYGDPSLVGYWKFDEGTGGTAYDSSGHGNTGTLTNNPTWQTSASCVKGGCLSFSGGTDYVRVISSSSLNMTGAITMAAWISPTGFAGAYRRLIDKGYGTQYQITFGSDEPTTYVYCGIEITGTWRSASLTGSAVMNTWQHFVCSYDGSNIRIYKNGSLGATSPNYAGSIDTTNNNLGIGSNPGGTENFKGSVDDLRVYNRALSAAEVLAIYNSAK